MHNVAILGATGSVGQAAIDVVQHLGEPWCVWGLSGHRQLQRLADTAGRLDPPPRMVVTSDRDAAAACSPGLWPPSAAVLSGPEGLIELASAADVDVVVAAIVGRAGLESALAAIAAGKRIALANKETLVVAGPLVRQLLRDSTAELLPVDSEHSAIFQCLACAHGRPRRLILTASGGPFRDWTHQQMQQATVQAALAHPTWQMGPKISVDSATMMNKALEIIEARWLFDVPAEAIEVVVHPQSVIHSMVEFADSSIIAQLSPPDMRLPIQYALTHPERLPCPTPRLDRGQRWEWTLEPVDRERFPALELGFEVATAGGTAGAVLNAANEQSVGLFLDGQIRFTDIVPACRSAVDHHHFERHPTLERLLQLDRWARAEVRRWHCGAKS